MVVLERADEIGGTWREQHVSRLRVRHPVAPLLLLLRAQPGLVAHLLGPAGDRRVPAGGRRGGRDPRPHPHGCEVTRRDVGGGGRALARRDLPRRSCAARVLVAGAGPFSAPRRPRRARARALRRALLPLRRVGPRLRPRRQARGGRRHGGVGDPDRAARSRREVARLHVLQRTPPWVIPHRVRAIGPRERRLYRTRAGAPAARARRRLRRPGGPRPRVRQAPGADGAAGARRAGAPAPPGPRPRAAARG